MRKRVLLASALALSLLVCSGCTGGKTNGDGSVSVPPAQSVSSVPAEGSQPEEPEQEAPSVPDFAVERPSGEPLDEEMDQLCQVAVNYCESSTGHRPGVVRIDSEDEEGVTLQLYDDMGDHTATCAWYTIDPATMEGYDVITGEEIAFYSYMQEEPLKT